MDKAQKEKLRELRQAADLLILRTQNHEKAMTHAERCYDLQTKAEIALNNLQHQLVMNMVLNPKCPECGGHGCEVCKS